MTDDNRLRYGMAREIVTAICFWICAAAAITATGILRGDAAWVSMIVAVPASLGFLAVYGMLLVVFRGLAIWQAVLGGILVFVAAIFLLGNFFSSSMTSLGRGDVWYYVNGKITPDGLAAFIVPPFIWSVEFVIISVIVRAIFRPEKDY